MAKRNKRRQMQDQDQALLTQMIMNQRGVPTSNSSRFYLDQPQNGYSLERPERIASQSQEFRPDLRTGSPELDAFANQPSGSGGGVFNFGVESDDWGGTADKPEYGKDLASAGLMAALGGPVGAVAATAQVASLLFDVARYYGKDEREARKMANAAAKMKFTRLSDIFNYMKNPKNFTQKGRGRTQKSGRNLMASQRKSSGSGALSKLLSSAAESA